MGRRKKIEHQSKRDQTIMSILKNGNRTKPLTLSMIRRAAAILAKDPKPTYPAYRWGSDVVIQALEPIKLRIKDRQVFMFIGSQSFMVGMRHDSAKEAEWFVDMLASAINSAGAKVEFMEKVTMWPSTYGKTKKS